MSGRSVLRVAARSTAGAGKQRFSLVAKAFFGSPNIKSPVCKQTKSYSSISRLSTILFLNSCRSYYLPIFTPRGRPVPARLPSPVYPRRAPLQRRGACQHRPRRGGRWPHRRVHWRRRRTRPPRRVYSAGHRVEGAGHLQVLRVAVQSVGSLTPSLNSARL